MPNSLPVVDMGRTVIATTCLLPAYIEFQRQSQYLLCLSDIRLTIQLITALAININLHAHGVTHSQPLVFEPPPSYTNASVYEVIIPQ